MLDVFVRYLHFLGFMALFAALVIQHLWVSPVMAKSAVKRMAVIDAIYGISALVVFVCGMLLVLVVGKPAEFYASNPFLHIKVTLFLVAGLLSIYPTVFFMKSRKRDEAEVAVPKAVVMVIRMQLLLVLILPLLATLMAAGVGA